MAKKQTYAQKLRDPRWQKRRLEILNRDEWQCFWCGSKDLELHVHHKRYEKGKEPWESEDEDLVTMCAFCHAIEEWHKKTERPLSFIIRDKSATEPLKAYTMSPIPNSNRFTVCFFSYDTELQPEYFINSNVVETIYEFVKVAKI